MGLVFVLFGGGPWGSGFRVKGVGSVFGLGLRAH